MHHLENSCYPLRISQLWLNMWIWLNEVEWVYHQNKEYQRWSCKKEKKIGLFLLHIWWIQIWIIWIRGHFFWAGFWEIFRVSFFRGFRKKDSKQFKKKVLAFLHMRGISSHQNTMILLLPLQSWFWGNISSSILRRVWGYWNGPFQYDFWSSWSLGFEMGRNHIGILWKPSRSK